MLSRFSSLRFLATDILKFSTTKNATAASNLMLHTSTACHGPPKGTPPGKSSPGTSPVKQSPGATAGTSPGKSSPGTSPVKLSPGASAGTPPGTSPGNQSTGTPPGNQSSGTPQGASAATPPVTPPVEPSRIAVILWGCGNFDGTNVPEAMSLAIHLDKAGIKASYYAPNVHSPEWDHFFDRLVVHDQRNALVEASRLRPPMCEQPVMNLCLLWNRLDMYDGIIIPGGMFVWTADCLYDEEVFFAPDGSSRLAHAACQRKLLGTISAAGLLAARALQGVKITLGEDTEGHRLIEQAEGLGAQYEIQDCSGVSFCETYNVYSTPGSLEAKNSYLKLHEGIGNMVVRMDVDIRTRRMQC